MLTPTVKTHPDGPTFSRIIPGLMRSNEWGLDAAGLRDWIKAALDMGMTTFDHADIYGSYTNEARFGEALKLEPSLRDKMEIVTKCDIMLLSENRPNTYVHHYDTSKAHILASAEQSLKNLNTDVIDVLLIHRPDPLMHPAEIAEALGELLKAGKIRYAGVSNFTPSQFDMLQQFCDFPLVTNQVEFSPLFMEPMHDGTFDKCIMTQSAPMIWSPMAGGRLFTGGDERANRVRDALAKIGEEVNAPADQVALAWMMMHPSQPMPVMGTGKLERLQSAVDALNVTLDRQQWFTIWEASAGHEVP